MQQQFHQTQALALQQALQPQQHTRATLATQKATTPESRKRSARSAGFEECQGLEDKKTTPSNAVLQGSTNQTSVNSAASNVLASAASAQASSADLNVLQSQILFANSAVQYYF